MKHAILGARAVDELVGAALAHEGDRVTLLVCPQTLAQHPGMLCLTRPYDTIEALVRIETRLAEPVDPVGGELLNHAAVRARIASGPPRKRGARLSLIKGLIAEIDFEDRSLSKTV